MAAQYPIYTEPTFRVYEPAFAKDKDGKPITIQACEEWVEGRWEGFVSVVKGHRALVELPDFDLDEVI